MDWKLKLNNLAIMEKTITVLYAQSGLILTLSKYEHVTIKVCHNEIVPSTHSFIFGI